MALGPFSAKDHVVITTLGLEFAVAVGMGVAVGFWLDKKYSTFPWAMIAGVMCGFALGLYIIVKESHRLSQTEKITEDKKKNGSI
mgnify:CR=1 FL=1